MKKSKNYKFRAIILNPLVLVVYGIICYYLYSLLQYGGVSRKVPIILLNGIILLIWFLWSFYKNRKQEKSYSEKHYYKTWYSIAIFILISITLVTGANIYKSGTNLNGKLAWFIHDLKNKRQIEYIHNNVYVDGLQGLFLDIEEKVELPEELYVSNEFRLEFDNNGEVNYIYTYLYGKNEKGETQSFLISYDRSKDEDIIVLLGGYVDADFDDEMKLRPIMEIMDWISLEDIVNQWVEKEYGILYVGVRNWGYNTDGILYIGESGEIREAGIPFDEIIGYTLSVYVLGKEDIITPVRYIHDELKVSREKIEETKLWEIGYNYNDGEETYFINENLGYQLPVVDAALGSRFYALLQTQDGGDTWESVNSDPFLGHTGVSSGIKYIDEDLGFIGLSHSGGSYAELYRTEDGGFTFEKIVIPEVEVSLNESETYNPFDFPDMPYEENGKLYLFVGQGQDGDYNGGIKALYQSEDSGKTWEYLKE